MERRRLALLSGYAFATFLAFPQPVAGRVVDLGIVLAWASPGLLVLGLDGLAPGRAARAGFAAALAAHAAILHWIYVVTVVYGHAPAAVGVVAPILLAAYVAAFTAGFGAGCAWLAARGAASPFALALLWTALDHLRSFALSGMPWATLGYAQHANAALLELAPYTGVYGLSFATVLGGVALARGARNALAGGRPGAGVWAALAAVAALHLAGIATATRPPGPGAPTVRVAVLQGNIDQAFKWSPDWAERTLGIYEELSLRAASQGAELIVWPETAVPAAIDADPALQERIARLARETGASLVVGAIGLGPGADSRRVGFYDSAFLLGADGELVARYDKSHLVPFGEYVPLRDLLGLGLRAVARGIASDNVMPGPGPQVFQLAVGAEGPRRITVGVPICYELVFPDLVRRFVRDGAEILLAITNDAWYGRTGAPYQFLAITALRSAETRVWTARAANTGVSAIIDERGRVRARTRIFERGLLVHDVPLRPPPLGGSFYTRHGDVFAWACWLGVAGLAWRARSRGVTPG
ncbi:MAG: apolipoprotein N-acyltransferase [Myxococcota bacterium]